MRGLSPRAPSKLYLVFYSFYLFCFAEFFLRFLCLRFTKRHKPRMRSLSRAPRNVFVFAFF